MPIRATDGGKALLVLWSSKKVIYFTFFFFVSKRRTLEDISESVSYHKELSRKVLRTAHNWWRSKLYSIFISAINFLRRNFGGGFFWGANGSDGRSAPCRRPGKRGVFAGPLSESRWVVFRYTHARLSLCLRGSTHTWPILCAHSPNNKKLAGQADKQKKRDLLSACPVKKSFVINKPADKRTKTSKTER